MRAPRVSTAAVAVAALFVSLSASILGLDGCGTNKPGAGAGKNTGGSPVSSGGTGGASAAGGSGGSTGVLSEDDRLCADSVAAQASVSCPDSLGRFGRCKTAFAADVCLPEVRAVLRCATTLGADAFECVNGMTDLKKAACEAESKALSTCIFPPSQKAQQKR